MNEDKDKQAQQYSATMALFCAIIALIIIAVLSSCKSSKGTTTPSIPTVPIQNETEVKYIHTERIDTVFIEIPAQSAERTTPEGFSHLETDYAESDAKINADGTLSHTLRNKPQPKPVLVKNETDTIYIDSTIEKPVPVEVPVAVERELTWWEETRLNTWGWLALIILAAVGWTFRNHLLQLLRRIAHIG